MSGVIDEHGNQFEHCHGCTGEGTPEYSPRGKWVLIQNLCYEEPTDEFPFGRDLCSDCIEQSVKEGKNVDLIPPSYTIDLTGGGREHHTSE